MTYDLTANETKALLALVQSCLDGMGGERPSDLEYDEYTWIDLNDLISAGWTRHEAAGTFSTLASKGLILEYEEKEWVLNTATWRFLDTIWDNRAA